MENTPDKNTQQNGQLLAIITAYFCTQESIQRIQTSAVVNNLNFEFRQLAEKVKYTMAQDSWEGSTSLHVLTCLTNQSNLLYIDDRMQ